MAILFSLLLTQLSLFFDILLCMAQGVAEEAFVKGQSPGMGSGDTQDAAATRNARSVLWKALHGVPLTMGEAVNSPMLCF